MKPSRREPSVTRPSRWIAWRRSRHASARRTRATCWCCAKREGAKDFFWKANIRDLEAEEVALDIHHIFPKDWCQKQGIPVKLYDSIINKTPISYKANRMIGGSAPSVYLGKLQSHAQVQLDDAAMDALLVSYCVPVAPLRADDFHAFYAERQQELLRLIEKVMGKGAAAL
jgi:hypothetical protein